MGKEKSLLRYLEGYELGLLAVAIAFVGTILAIPVLAIPMRVAPSELPLPIPDRRALSATVDRERALSASLVPALRRELANPAAGTELYDLRAFGERFREYGHAESSSDPYTAVHARKALLEVLPRAKALGDDKLLGLRGYQQQLFFDEVRRWENSGVQSAELTGLGGKFIGLVSQAGWHRDRSIDMDETLRGIFFKRRWTEVTGLAAPPYGLTMDEQRAFFAFLLTHPFVEGQDKMNPKEACRAVDQWRLRKIEDLGRADPQFPRYLARGVLLYRLKRYSDAADAFRDHLAIPDGRFTLRARNYLAATTERAGELEAP